MPITIPMARARLPFSGMFFPLRARWLIERHGSEQVLRPADEGPPHTEPGRVLDPSPHELRTTLRLQFHQQLLDAVFFFERGQTFFHVVGGDLGLCLAEGFAVGDFAFHAVEGGGA